MDKKPMYFQLEPNAFLSDIDFQAMTAQERGVYFTLILYLYANGGTVGVAKGTLYGLCNYGCDMLEWEQMWDNIKHKFVVNGNGELTHKRVTQEIEEATHRMEVSRESGLRGADKRWAGHRVAIADKDRVAIAKKRKGKVSKEKNNNPPTVPPKKKLFIPPTIEDVKEYICQNPELNNIDPVDFWKGYADGDWIDTRGNPVRNWKLKLRTRSRYDSGGAGRPQETSKRSQKPHKDRSFPVPSPEDPNYVEG